MADENMVTLEIDDKGNAVVSLNRPDRSNALSLEMFKCIFEVGCELREKENLRSVILKGNGKNFCTGFDIKSKEAMIFLESKPGDLDKVRDLDFFKPVLEDRGQSINLVQAVAYVWSMLPVPVIAVLQGKAYGGGLQLALGADLRYAASDVQCSFAEVKIGLIPDMAATVTAPFVLRKDKAFELMATGKIIEGESLLNYGLVTEICEDPLAKAQEVVQELYQYTPESLTGVKDFVNTFWQNSETNSAFETEGKLQTALIASENRLTRLQAAFGLIDKAEYIPNVWSKKLPK